MSATRCQVVLFSRLACGSEGRSRAGRTGTVVAARVEQLAVHRRAAAARAAMQGIPPAYPWVAAQLPVDLVAVAGVQGCPGDRVRSVGRAFRLA